jgi:hypothetical protein
MRKALICLFCLICVGLFAQGIPYGREFQVNLYTQNDQGSPSAVFMNGGKIAITWDSYGQAGAGYSVFGRLINPADPTEGGEFLIHQADPEDQRYPNVAALQDGGFVVCWNGKGRDGFPYSVAGQIFDPAGSKKGAEFIVTSSDLYPQWLPGTAALSGGRFAVSWASDWRYDPEFSVFGQLFNGSGAKTGEKFQINTLKRYYQGGPQTSALAGGGYVVCWQAWEQDGIGSVYGRIFGDNGENKGEEFRINLSSDDQWRPSVAALEGGGFVVCWQKRKLNGSGSGVCGQVFDGAGRKIGGELQIKNFSREIQWRPAAAALPGGGFVVCWQSDERDNEGYGVFGRLFNSSGESLGGEFRISDRIRNDQQGPKVSSLSAEGFLVYWASQNPNTGDSDIYAKVLPNSPIVHVLSPFSLVAPGSDASIQSTRTVLSWRQASGLTVCYPWELNYKTLIDDNPDFQSPEVIEQDQDTTIMIQNLQPGTTYFWKVLAKNIAGDSLWSSNTSAFFVMHDATSGVDEHQLSKPNEFMLHQNYPNPFNPETSIKFDLPQPGFILISVIDVSGRLVRKLVSESRKAGSYSVKWDGKDSEGNAVPSGIYVCRMEVCSAEGSRFTQSVKMGLVR